MPAKHQIGVFGATCYVVGRIIGAGIFITPTSILRHAGSVGASLVVWVLCGVLSMIGALTYVELGTSMPLSGSDYAYADYVSWRPISFVAVFVTGIGIIPVSRAVASLSFAQYVFEAIPGHENVTGFHQTYVTLAFGLSLFYSLTGVNFFRIDRYAVSVQVITTIIKLCGLIVIAGFGIAWMIQGKTAPHTFEDSFANTTDSVGSFILALYSGFFTYGGWDQLNSVVEEVHNPQRTLPLAIVAGLLIVAAVYLTAYTSFLAVLGKEGLLASKAVAEDFGQATWVPLGYAMPVIVGISIAGNLNAAVMAYSRFYSTAARKGYLPTALSLVHLEQSTPVPALCFLMLLTTLALQVHSIDTLVNVSSFLANITTTGSGVVLLYIRWKKIPVHRNAVRFPIAVPVSFVIIQTCLIILPIYQNPGLSLGGLGFACIGFLLYLVFVRWRRHLPKALDQADRAVTVFLQKLFYAGTDYEALAAVLADISRKDDTNPTDSSNITGTHITNTIDSFETNPGDTNTTGYAISVTNSTKYSSVGKDGGRRISPSDSAKIKHPKKNVSNRSTKIKKVEGIA